MCPPFVIKGIDVAAQTFGAQALANWLGKSSSVFAGKEQAISRSLVVAGTVTTCIALYKIYQILITEEEDSVDETDMFSNFNFGKN